MKISEIRSGINNYLAMLAKELSKPKLPLDEMAAALVVIRETEKLCKEDQETLKPTMVERIKAGGKLQPGTKTILLTIGSWVLKMHPTASGLDPQKVASELVMMKKDPARCGMIEKKKYDMPIEGTRDYTKLLAMFSPEKLKEMEYEERWTLKTPEEA